MDSLGGWVVLGGLVESWQYARTAPSRLMLAAERAHSALAHQVWAQLARDEAAWAKELEAGLERAVDAEELGRACPLPGTAALCEQMRLAANSDDLADQLGYAACVGAASAADASSNGLHAYYNQLTELGVAPAEVIEPFLRYAAFAAQRAERDPVRAIFAEQPPLSLESRRVVLGHLAAHVHAIVHFHRNIFEFYTGAARLNLRQPDGSAGVRDCSGE
jgi:hypothetical protein